MTHDSLKNIEHYESLNKNFKKVFSYIKSLKLSDLSDGKHEIDGQNVFMTVSSSKLRALVDAPLESHKKYIDIQIVIQGEECFGWASKYNSLAVSEKYSESNDIEFYQDLPTSYLTVQEGEFVIFFPEDCHAPLIGDGSVKKCIIKVAV